MRAMHCMQGYGHKCMCMGLVWAAAKESREVEGLGWGDWCMLIIDKIIKWESGQALIR